VREDSTPEKLFERLQQAGRLDELRADLAQSQAVDFLAEQARAIPVERAQAREQLWTPEDDAPPGGEQAPGKLWTPGS
jgi:predicted component of type VI protein secretion system